MKVEKSSYISPFGGINFVFEHLKSIGFNKLLSRDLPKLANQCTYCWSDIINSLFAVFFCGGDCIEDLGNNFKYSLSDNPYVKIPSPDRVLARLKQLSEPKTECKTEKGTANHTISINNQMNKLLVEVLKTLSKFDGPELMIDYDNTFLFAEKADCKMSYKKDYAYHPAVVTLNTQDILYIENRNGNSDPRSFQKDTLERLFLHIEEEIKGKTIYFRADSASYLYSVVKCLEEKKAIFFIGAKTNSLLKYIKNVEQWEKSTDKKGEPILIGEIKYIPFKEYLTNSKRENPDHEYRLVIKKKIRPDGQINLITQEAYEYRTILTNDENKNTREVIDVYDKRGDMERQFDILKNDFGWKNMPFSKIEENTVFLILMAICRNLYGQIITHFSSIVPDLEANFRIKKFIFRFITIPAKWIRRSRQMILKIYGRVDIRI